MEDEQYEFWDFLRFIESKFPRMYRLQVPCPAVGEPLHQGGFPTPDVCSTGYVHTVPWIIAHLNDSHRWRRDKIADWLDLTAAEHGLDLSLPTPENIPPEPGEEAVNNT